MAQQVDEAIAVEIGSQPGRPGQPQALVPFNWAIMLGEDGFDVLDPGEEVIAALFGWRNLSAQNRVRTNSYARKG